MTVKSCQFLGGIASTIPPIATDVSMRGPYVCLSVCMYICMSHSCTLLKPLENEMPFGRDTHVAPQATLC